MVMLTTKKDIEQKNQQQQQQENQDTDESKHAENTCEAGKQYRLLT